MFLYNNNICLVINYCFTQPTSNTLLYTCYYDFLKVINSLQKILLSQYFPEQKNIFGSVFKQHRNVS